VSISCRSSTAEAESSRCMSSTSSTHLRRPGPAASRSATAANPATGSDRSTPAGSRWAIAPSGTAPAAALAVARPTRNPAAEARPRHSSASRDLPTPAARPPRIPGTPGPPAPRRRSPAPPRGPPTANAPPIPHHGSPWQGTARAHPRRASPAALHALSTCTIRSTPSKSLTPSESRNARRSGPTGSPFRRCPLQEEAQGFLGGGVGCGVGHQQLVGVGVDGELLYVEGHGARYRVVVGLRELPRSAHLVAGPPGAEVRVADAEFTDQGGQGPVVGAAARLHPEDGDALACGARPVRVQGAEGVVEEGQPDQVALGRRQRAEVGQQGGRSPVPGQYIHTPVQHHRGNVTHALQQAPQPWGDLWPARRPRAGAGAHIGQGEQVGAFVRGELQRVGERVQDRTGDPAGAALFQPDDIVHAHVRQLGQLLPAQPRDTAQASVVRQADAVRVEGRTAGAQKAAQLIAVGRIARVFHDSSVRKISIVCLVLVRIGSTVPGTGCQAA
jgi:hypothetical protein